MAVFRIQKSRDYTVMSNNHFKNRRLSLKAKGLLSLMLSLPDNWDYTLEGLATLNTDGRESVRTAVQELEAEGYLRRGQGKNEAGKYGGAIYDVFEQPYAENPMSENPTSGKPISENPMSENPTQLNTNKSNTNGLNTKESNTYVVRRKPTLKEIRDYCNERDNNVDAEKFFDYYESNGWKVGRNPMKDWKAAIRTWERNDEHNKKQSGEATTRTPEEEERLAYIKKRFGIEQ